MGIDFLNIGSIIKNVTDIADDLITTDEEKLKLYLQEKEIVADIDKGQAEINREEAKHKSIFTAGWRPFIGWIGAIALAYQFVLYPFMLWAWTIFEAKGVILSGVSPPPPLDSDVLFGIITGMLGIAGMRSYDKIKGTQTDKIMRRTKVKGGNVK